MSTGQRMAAIAAEADEQVAAVLETSTRYRTVSGIAHDSGLTPARVRAALRRLDKRGILRCSDDGFPVAYQLTGDELRDRRTGRLRQAFQGFIDDEQTPPGERTEAFTIDAAAYYKVTPLQFTALLALAPPDIAAMNERPS
jgi:DNA-binding transcriptional ArsR family regulator